MRKDCVVIVDPNSYNNLSLYDKLLLENLPINDKYLIGNYKYEYELNSSFKLYRIYNYSNNYLILKALLYLIGQIRLILLLLWIKPSVIHFQWFKWPRLDFLVLIVLKLLFKNCTYVFTAHNVLPHDSGLKFYEIFKKIYTKIDKIVVHDNSTKSEIVTRFNILESKISVIPHGILDFSTNVQSKTQKENVITFSFLGHLSMYKGIDILIETWSNYKELNNNPNIKLVIAGKSSSKSISDKLKTLSVFDNVYVNDNFLSNEEFNLYLDKSDVVILPYLNISQSGILLTSLARKKAVIVSNVGGLVQPFNIGKVGWVLNENTPIELKKLIEYICKNPHELEKIHHNEKLWNDIEKYYCWKSIGVKTFKTYLS